MEGIDDRRGRLTALAERVRALGVLGRSDLMNRLFDYLLETSLGERTPKEFEVAQEVFGKSVEFDMAQDASVRVYIHRLRKKLEEVPPDAAGERLTVPRGEYRLIVERADAAVPAPAEDEEIEPAPLPPERRSRIGARLFAAALLVTLLIGAVLGGALWSAWSRSTARNPLAATALWAPIVRSANPTTIALGDYYIFGEAPDAVQVTRLLREFAINSREDLDQLVMHNPQLFGRYVDLDLHYLPVGVGPALRDLVPVLNALTTATAAGPPRVITSSRLSPETLKRANIVYVGLLSSLGLLRDPLFEGSGFRIGSSYDELIDGANERHYTSDLGEGSAGNRKPRRDFAYLASFPGPTGNHVLVVSGTRDPAVMQAAEIASDPAQLAQIERRGGTGEAFEALYEVWSVDRQNVGSTLLVARPLKRGDLWRAGRAQEEFPDEPAPEHGAAAPAE